MRSGLLETLSRNLPPGMLLRMIRLDEVVQTAWGEQQPSVALATHPGAGAWAEEGPGRPESGRVESFVCLLQLSESLLGATHPPGPDGSEGAGGGVGAEGAGVEGGNGSNGSSHSQNGPSDLSGVRFLRAAERLVTLLGVGERAAMTKATWPKRAEEMDRLARELDDAGLRVSGGEAFQRPSTRFLVLSLACPVQSLGKHPELFGANLRLDVAKATVGHPSLIHLPLPSRCSGKRSTSTTIGVHAVFAKPPFHTRAGACEMFSVRRAASQTQRWTPFAHGRAPRAGPGRGVRAARQGHPPPHVRRPGARHQWRRRGAGCRGGPVGRSRW
jgi:hypothetical protein